MDAQLDDDGASSLEELVEAVGAEDPERAAAAVDVLAARIARADRASATAAAGQALAGLRGRRRFPAMLRVAEGAFRAGVDDVTVSRLYAQALIEEGLLGAALATLAPLRTTPGPEGVEIVGLIGRAHKQRYVDSPESAAAEQHLAAAIDAYLGAYTADPENLWPGVNALAVLARAERDGTPTPGRPAWPSLAHRLLATVAERELQGLRPWDAAVAAEANLALGDFPAAARSLATYTQHAEADAFQLAATLRQLRQVWQIDEADPRQRALVDLLEARLLRAEGGTLAVTAGQRADELDANAKYLEAVLGEDEYQTVQWYRAGLEAAKSVVRIKRRLGPTIGTGFVLPGAALHPSWAGRSVVVTNFHVANRDAVPPGRAPTDLRVVFEDNGVEVPIREILWESPFVTPGTNPPASLDTAILLLDREPIPAPSYELSPGPPPGLHQRVYVIGYPGGLDLAFSLHDNKVVGASAALLHYRAPTRPGSSGSPVFDDEWRLVGIHHAGGPDIARLDDPYATYSANEGLLLSAIRERLGTPGT